MTLLKMHVEINILLRQSWKKFLNLPVCLKSLWAGMEFL